MLLISAQAQKSREYLLTLQYQTSIYGTITMGGSRAAPIYTSALRYAIERNTWINRLTPSNVSL